MLDNFPLPLHFNCQIQVIGCPGLIVLPADPYPIHPLMLDLFLMLSNLPNSLNDVKIAVYFKKMFQLMPLLLHQFGLISLFHYPHMRVIFVVFNLITCSPWLCLQVSTNNHTSTFKISTCVVLFIS